VARLGVHIKHGGMSFPAPTTKVGCSLANRYNFGCVTASDSMFDSGGGFSGSAYLTKTLPRSELLHASDCQVGLRPTF